MRGSVSLPRAREELRRDRPAPSCVARTASTAAAAEALFDLFAQLAGAARAPAPRRRRRRTGCAGGFEGLAVGSATPAPGHVHAARLGRAGWSGRPHTFVLGLDEARFPGPPRQDPVLLDSERDTLNRGRGGVRLALPGRALTAMRIAELHELLARIRGRAILSFSNRDILQDAGRLPRLPS